MYGKRKKDTSSGAMLDLWRPPNDAGDPVGCLATTYTFAPGLRRAVPRPFLDIESEPNREDLAFLLEREGRLGGVYAGVLVDHTGREWSTHSVGTCCRCVSLAAKQHAKISLSCGAYVRIIVASANLSEPGYRTNYEVAAAVDLTPEGISNDDMVAQAITFLRSLLSFVPGRRNARRNSGGGGVPRTGRTTGAGMEAESTLGVGPATSSIHASRHRRRSGRGQQP
jgi:hypothetical protein